MNQTTCIVRLLTMSLTSTPYLLPFVVMTHTALLTARSCPQTTLEIPRLSPQHPPTALHPTTMSYHPHSQMLCPSPLLRPPGHPPSHSVLCLQKPTNDTPPCHPEWPQESSIAHGPTMAPTTNPYLHKMLRTCSSSKKTSATPSTPPPIASSPPSIATQPSSTASSKKSTSRSWCSKTLWPNIMKSSSTFNVTVLLLRLGQCASKNELRDLG